MYKYYKERNGTGHVMHWDANQDGEMDKTEHFILFDTEGIGQHQSAFRILKTNQYRLYQNQLIPITRDEFLLAFHQQMKWMIELLLITTPEVVMILSKQGK